MRNGKIFSFAYKIRKIADHYFTSALHPPTSFGLVPSNGFINCYCSVYPAPRLW
jgi:hypothetical protein